MTEGLIGVIVPVYKVEKYIAECIESILAQTYTKFRLILVDDGTPDNAGRICDEYAKKDSRITVIHQENAGVTRARARGVEEASDCEWITFVDGDDTLQQTAIQNIFNATGPNTRIVITDKVLWYPQIDTDTISAFEFQKRLICEEVSSAPWGKLFSRGLFNKYVFDIPREIVMGEDLIMNLRLSKRCNEVVVIHDSLYNYNIHEENICHNFVDNAEHEYLFYSNIKDFMSTHSHYIIARNLKKWDRFFGYSYKTPEWYGSDIHKSLLNDIKIYKHRTNHIEYSLLTCANPIKRYVIIFIRKCWNKIREFI